MAALISVTNAMVTGLSPNPGNFMSLFDGNDTTFWFANWGNYPAKIVIDLQTTHQIDKFRVFDGYGSPTVKFGFADAPFEVTSTINHPLTGFLQWADVPVNKTARFIYVEIADPQGDKPLGGLEIFAVSAGGGTPSVATPKETPTYNYGEASQTICTNSFHWVPLDILTPFSIVREYNYWNWYEAKKGINAFEPSFETNAYLDTHFAELKAKGIKPLFCNNLSPSWMNTYADYDQDDRPTDTPTALSDAPASYSYIARFMFQFTARYGRATIAANRLTIDASNTKKSGLNLVEYVSPWNEPDKWWKGARGNIKANEYAAMLSAIWDGHEGRIAGDVGVKKADPTMKVVLGGLTDFRIDYIADMYAWFKANRTDKVFCADIIDLHHYSGNYGKELFASYAKGVAPETEDFKGLLKQAVDYVKQFVPGKELWVTEFGYDTGTASPQRSTAYGSYSVQEVQAMWNIRSYMECIAAGADRAFVFNIYDESNDQVGIFQTSGVVRSRADNLTKKVAWHKISELATKLKGLSFKGDQSKTANVRNYLFTNADNSKRLAVMWCPTENSTTVSNYVFENKTYLVSEMPNFVDVSASAGTGTPTIPPTTGTPQTGVVNTKKVLVTLDDTNKVGSKTTTELMLSTNDEIWVNGVKFVGDIQIVVKRAASPVLATTGTTTSVPVVAPTMPPPSIVATDVVMSGNKVLR
jgi:hypothetical protein